MGPKNDFSLFLVYACTHPTVYFIFFFLLSFFVLFSGALSDSGVTRQTECDSARTGEPVVQDVTVPETKNIPSFSDMKICYSTIQGYNAFRDPDHGSWYVNALCRVFAEHAHDTHLEDLLKLIGTVLAQVRNENAQLQTPSNEDRGFTKQLFFNPGYPPLEPDANVQEQTQNL